MPRGSVARYLAQYTPFEVRGLTRNPDSKAAQELKLLGIEVFQCDINDSASLDRALEGMYGIFITTDYYQPEILANPQHEIEQGKRMADAAKRAQIKHIIHSSLPSISQMSQGKYNDVHHFDNKAKITNYLYSLNLPVTVVRYGFYMSNWIETPEMFQPDPETPGGYCVGVPVSPQTQVPLFDTVDDGGSCVGYCFLNPRETIGKTYDLAYSYKSFDQMAHIMSKRAGAPIRAVQLDEQAIAQHPMYKNHEILRTFQFFSEYHQFTDESLHKTRETFGGLTDFGGYLTHIEWKLK
ncbi:hypothetical protein H4R35_005209 [Dimargaris xerosporica]|nr:hypothetical protein H4R35_005209 [Dimargaris xerosporica]